MPTVINRDLFAGFQGEVKSYLPRIRAGLANAGADHTSPDFAQAHRLIHSIKGAASMIGLAGLGHIAFLGEELLAAVAAGELVWSAQVYAAVSTILRLIEVYVDNLASGTLHERPLRAQAVKAMRRLRDEPECGDMDDVDRSAMLDGDPTLAVDRSIEDLPIEDLAVQDLSTHPKRASVPPGPRTTPTVISAEQIVLEYQNIPADLLDTFRQEAEEIFNHVGELLRSLEVSGSSPQTLLDIRRQVHTLKGAAGSVGLLGLSALAHRMEDLLDAIHEESIAHSGAVSDLLFSTFDCLNDIAEARNIDGIGVRTQALLAHYSDMLDNAPVRGRESDGVSAVDSAAIPHELMDAFRAEVEGHFGRVGERLRELQENSRDKTVIEDLRRALHMLTSAANMIGKRSMSAMAHAAENLLLGDGNGEVSLSVVEVSLLFSTSDMLADLAGAPGQDAEPAGYRDLLASIQRTTSPSAPDLPLDPLGAERPIDVPALSEAPAGAEPAHAPTHYVRVPIERIDELVRLVGELVVNRSTFEQYLAGYAHEVDELALSMHRLKRISSRLDADFEVSTLRGGFGQLAVRAIESAPNQENIRPDFDSLEFDRYTDFHRASRDLTETAGDVSSATGELTRRMGDFDSYLNRLGRLTGEVQDKLMRMRMVPLLTLGTRLHRTVRVTGDQAGKSADLLIEGEAVELDKTVLEEMAGPLEHLLRNAVAHGVETEATRRVLGKRPRGQIRVRAFHRGTSVMIEVSDDGAGMQPDRLRDAAVRCGLYSSERAAQLTIEQLEDLIFRPGFSTAPQVNETSGRGVGMDVVKSTVNRLKGTISLQTEPGSGTTFRIQLPMTLAIMRVMLVKANGQVLAVPLSAVTRILRIEPEQLERIGETTVIRVDNRIIPAIGLGKTLHLKVPPDATPRKMPVLIISMGDREIAVIVDGLIEAREVVVKTTGSVLRQVEGILGCTLMGDGSVVLIVNPADIVAPLGASVAREPATESQPTRVSRGFNILIADDSLSVRRVLSNLIRNTGWVPVTARDGVEALEILERGVHPPDAVLLDVEMPRMDGYELLAWLRSRPAWRHLPVIMLTSRAGEKHRRRAFDLGATDYLVKPYEEDTLLALIRRVVREAREMLAT